MPCPRIDVLGAEADVEVAARDQPGHLLHGQRDFLGGAGEVVDSRTTVVRGAGLAECLGEGLDVARSGTLFRSGVGTVITARSYGGRIGGHGVGRGVQDGAQPGVRYVLHGELPDAVRVHVESDDAVATPLRRVPPPAAPHSSDQR